MAILYVPRCTSHWGSALPQNFRVDSDPDAVAESWLLSVELGTRTGNYKKKLENGIS